jgi:hypothetical protein
LDRSAEDIHGSAAIFDCQRDEEDAAESETCGVGCEGVVEVFVEYAEF